MNIRNSKERELLFQKKRITKLFTSLEHEREVKIREKAFDMEKKLKDIFPTPAFIGPVREDQAAEMPRFQLSSDNMGCFFSQIRMEFHMLLNEEEGKSIEQSFNLAKNRTRRIFSAFQELTSRKIKRMGAICDILIPFREEENAVLYLQNTFFKFKFNPKFTGLDFHFAYRHKDKYNVNIFVDTRKSATKQNVDFLFVKLDINDYFDQQKRKVPFYELDEIDEIFSVEKDFVLNNLDKILRNESISEKL